MFLKGVRVAPKRREMSPFCISLLSASPHHANLLVCGVRGSAKHRKYSALPNCAYPITPRLKCRPLRRTAISPRRDGMLRGEEDFGTWTSYYRFFN